MAMAALGRPETLSVTVDEMVHHTRAAAAGSRRALLAADLPFGSYHASVLYQTPADDDHTEHRRRAQVSRMLAKLIGHGLVQRLERSHLYHVTADGYRAMGAALFYRQIDYPTNYALA